MPGVANQPSSAETAGMVRTPKAVEDRLTRGDVKGKPACGGSLGDVPGAVRREAAKRAGQQASFVDEQAVQVQGVALAGRTPDRRPDRSRRATAVDCGAGGGGDEVIAEPHHIMGVAQLVDAPVGHDARAS